MKYVIDSSVAVKWAIPEADTAKALRLRDDYGRSPRCTGCVSLVL